MLGPKLGLEGHELRHGHKRGVCLDKPVETKRVPPRVGGTGTGTPTSSIKQKGSPLMARTVPTPPRPLKGAAVGGSAAQLTRWARYRRCWCPQPRLGPWGLAGRAAAH